MTKKGEILLEVIIIAAIALLVLVILSVLLIRSGVLFNTEKNETFQFMNASNFSHTSIAPFEQFCYEINKSYKHGSAFSDQGCIDANGEIHYYQVKVEIDKWIIGNKSYPVEWE